MERKQDLHVRDNKPICKALSESQRLFSERKARYIKNIGLHLNQHEKQYLYLSAQGKRPKEIALLLKVSPRKMSQYRQLILQKLNCKTLSSAIIVGIRYGEIKAADLLAGWG